MRWILDAEQRGERLRQRRLGDAGHAFEQDVAAGEQGDEELVRDSLHADDDLADFCDDAIAQVRISCASSRMPRHPSYCSSRARRPCSKLHGEGRG